MNIFVSVRRVARRLSRITRVTPYWAAATDHKAELGRRPMPCAA